MNSKSRHIVIIVLSLCFTRVAMDTLGHPDYGICMLMSGIVSLLICAQFAYGSRRASSFPDAHGGKISEIKTFAISDYIPNFVSG